MWEKASNHSQRAGALGELARMTHIMRFSNDLRTIEIQEETFYQRIARTVPESLGKVRRTEDLSERVSFKALCVLRERLSLIYSYFYLENLFFIFSFDFSFVSEPQPLKSSGPELRKSKLVRRFQHAMPALKIHRAIFIAAVLSRKLQFQRFQRILEDFIRFGF